MRAAVVCLGRLAVGHASKKYQLGTGSEQTYWSDLAQALEAASRLAWPLCGPRCMGVATKYGYALGVHLLVWRSRDRYHVLDLTRLDLDPRNRRREFLPMNRKSSREAHQARTLEKLIAEGHFDLAAAVTNGDMTVTQAQTEYRQRRSNR